MPESAGTFDNKFLRAASPPAEAPMPTIKAGGFSDSWLTSERPQAGFTAYPRKSSN